MGAPIRISDAQSEARIPPPVNEPAVRGEWLSTYRQQIASQLATWKAPSLPDDVLDAQATIFLMQPGHELTPFFVWLEHRLSRWAQI